jgi:hypothetical protein
MRIVPGRQRPCPPPVQPTRTAIVLLASVPVALLLLRPDSAHAVPSFAEQTGQPCAACHVGAFGPQLKQYGRDFKLNGYVATDGKDHGLPLAVSTQLSFTYTNNAQPGPAAPHFADNVTAQVARG